MYILVGTDQDLLKMTRYYAQRKKERFRLSDEAWNKPDPTEASNLIPLENDIKRISFMGHGGFIRLKNGTRVCVFGESVAGSADGQDAGAFYEYLLVKKVHGDIPDSVHTLDFMACNLGLTTTAQKSWIEQFEFLIKADSRFDHIKRINAVRYFDEENQYSSLIAIMQLSGKYYFFSANLLTQEDDALDEKLKHETSAIEETMYATEHTRQQIVNDLRLIKSERSKAALALAEAKFVVEDLRVEEENSLKTAGAPQALIAADFEAKKKSAIDKLAEAELAFNEINLAVAKKNEALILTNTELESICVAYVKSRNALTYHTLHAGRPLAVNTARLSSMHKFLEASDDHKPILRTEALRLELKEGRSKARRPPLKQGSSTPEVSASPEASASPEVSASPEASASPEVSTSPEASASPQSRTEEGSSPESLKSGPSRS